MLNQHTPSTDALRRCGTAPSDPNAWDRLGLILMAAGAHKLAQAAFGQAEALAPAAVDFALHGIEAATALGTLAEILPTLEVRCEADPLNLATHIARGVAFERLGRHDEALDALEIATVLAPDAALPATLLGGILARSNRLQEAEAALRRAYDLTGC